MTRGLWMFFFFFTSARSGSSNLFLTNNLNQSCPYQKSCNPTVNFEHMNSMMTYVDDTKNPCNDFYAYACGNWKRNLTATKVSEKQITNLYQGLFHQLLKNPRAPEHGYPMYAKLMTHYKHCTGLKALRVSRYLDLLSLPSPLNSSNWMELLALLGRYGYHGHFVQLEVRWHNARQHMIFLQPHNHRLHLNLTQAIYEALPSRDFALGTWPNYTHLQTQFIELENKLDSLVNPVETDESFFNYSLDYIQLKVPKINWTAALAQQLRRSSFNGDHAFQVDNLTAIQALVDYLNDEDQRLLNLYSLARFLSYLLHLPHNPLTTWDSIGETLSLRCIQNMRRALYLPMNYVYERSFYGANRKTDEIVIQRVFAELQEQLKESVKSNPFKLKPNLVTLLMAKVQSMRINVGNLPLNASEQFFWDCDRRWILGQDFYENHLNSLLFYYSLTGDLVSSTNTSERSIWYSFNMHSPDFADNIDATPYFYCLGNIVFVPYSYVKLPFFHAHFWPALLYGDLANTLGHEMMHAFDTFMVDYDAQGNMSNFSEQLGEEQLYRDAVDCLNSSDVILNERTSDVSGSRLAIRTYMGDWLSQLDNGKVYFLQFSQFFCGDEGDKYHETGKKRLNYALSQVPEFAEMFQCAKGTEMNPSKQCQFW
ncbi:hypothetical protein KR009_008997 [Drosophila setifemur]|nr:hypothetical protein KR009_008997 [Drosophila setifemur]